MEDHDAETQLMREFKLSQQMAEVCIRIASGEEPIDAVKTVYNYTNVTNAYGQLKKIMLNPKVDSALKSLGMNLRDKYEKHAYAIVTAYEKIAFNDSSRFRASSLCSVINS